MVQAIKVIGFGVLLVVSFALGYSYHKPVEVAGVVEQPLGAGEDKTVVIDGQTVDMKAPVGTVYGKDYVDGRFYLDENLKIRTVKEMYTGNELNVAAFKKAICGE